MKIHRNAALTGKQRQQVQALYASGAYTQQQLAIQFATTRKTIGKWVNRQQAQDSSSAPRQPHHRVTDSYRQAVIAYRQAHPSHGPVRIAEELRPEFGTFAASTVGLILRQAALNGPAKLKRAKAEGLPVGHYRTQMDVQQLPAIEGNTGFDGAARAVQDFHHPLDYPDEVFRDPRQLRKPYHRRRL
jgi:hypothetical protein